MTDWEYEYLKHLYMYGYRYVATNIDNETFAYTSRPEKNERGYWHSERKNTIQIFDKLGTSEEDQEPLCIFEALDETVDYKDIIRSIKGTCLSRKAGTCLTCPYCNTVCGDETRPSNWELKP